MNKPLKAVVRLDAVYNLIDEMNLTTRCRKNEYLIPRCILYNILYHKSTISLQSIGRLFKKNHATIINGLKKYDAYMICTDIEFMRYKELIEREVLDIPIKEKKTIEKTLIHKILECNNYYEMRLLQEELKLKLK